jgi:crotonobetainyl-CoA:carnitine CoA-transferase CaiB-like acyl-CoA transferase
MSANDPAPATGALQGLKVLDLTRAYSGPYCTQMLADHGADVIKVAPPEGEAGMISNGVYQMSNRNKRGIVLDLKAPAGREVLLRLVDWADVLVENFRPRVMERLGLGYESLAVRNPKLVYVAIRGFSDPRSGSTRYEHWPSYDVITQAMGGICGITGSDPTHPLPVGTGLGDALPGLMAAYAVMLGVFRARSSGRGQFIDVSMLDTMLSICQEVVTHYAQTGQVMRPSGARHPVLAPYGLFRAKDGFVAIAARADRSWRDFCDAIGRPELKDDPRFATDLARDQNRETTFAVVEDYTRTRTRQQIIDELGGRIAIGPVYAADDLLADEHFRIRDMIVEVEATDSGKPLAIVGVPIKLSETPGGIRQRAPRPGEHTEAVLQELGYSRHHIEELKAGGVLGRGL